MPIVRVKETIPVAPSAVWALICDVAAYPAIMEPVLRIDILEESGDELTTEWEVELKGSILQWIERERRLPDRMRIEYAQVDGDLEVFDGYWQLEPDGDGTIAELVVNFEIGIPMLKDMLDPVAKRAIEQNSIKMLRSLVPRE